MRAAIALALLVPSALADDDSEKVKDLIWWLGATGEETRADAARDLGALGPRAKAAVPALAGALGDTPLVAERAHDALRKIGPDGVPALVKALSSPDERVRAGVMKLLDESFALNLKPHLRTIAGMLKDGNASVRGSAAHALALQGEAALDHLLPVLGAAEAGAQEAAIEGLVAVGTIAVRPLVQTLRSGSDRARVGAAVALGKLRAEAAGEQLLAALADRSPDVGGAAALALGQAGALPDKAIPLLLDGLKSPKVPFRDGCIGGLIAYGEPARDGLVTTLAADDTRVAASLAFLRNSDAAVVTLKHVLTGDSVASRRAGLAITRLMKPWLVPDDLVDAVTRCLRQDDAAVRAAAARALAGLGPRAKGDDLRGAAADPDPAVRAAAVHALGALGEDPGHLDDEDPVVRVEAMLASWRSGGGSGAEDLVKIAIDAAAEPRVRAAAVTALGEMGLAAASVDLAPFATAQPVELRRAAVEALGRITRPSALAIRDARRAARPDFAVETGLAWLADAQGKDGEWDRGALTAGTSGLALLAFLGAGHGPGDPKHGTTVARGLSYLMSRQDTNGLLSSRESHEFVLCHGIATIALVEAWMLGGGDDCRRAAQRALDFIAWARNPGLAWRYEPRGGENDTHVTVWMVTALRLGDAAGLRVDAEAYAGAALWIDKMTDPDVGRIGYNARGGSPARPEGLQETFPTESVEPTTAAGLWCRLLIGGAPVKGPLQGKGIERLLAMPPSSRPSSRDLIYWHFGALALFQDGEDTYGRWEKALSVALAAGRLKTGAWATDDVWAGDGGPVYTTAMGVLTTLTPTRYPRDFLTKPKLSAASRAAIAALKKACIDDDARVREIAAAACARLDG